ncbi:MAG: leucine-rich repeat domain-containing protein [Treponema lecithinolyticum]|uniref:leucine-rich repeat domain-containing protein n=1 Tax=Treponema lecithinolyticum TaxID=53418 RepID=UPI00360E39E7
MFIGLALIALFGMTGCPNAAKPEEPPAPPEYTTVSFDKLADYLQKLPEGTATHYIEVTGLKKEHLKNSPGHIHGTRPLGAILNDNPTKKVALKLGGGITGLTDMSHCFAGCKNLVSAAAIPKGVTNMGACFENCTSLKQAPVIPEGVTNMEACFRGCTSLTKAPEIPNSVTDMKHCFNGCTALKQVPSISNTVTNMNECFSDCTNLTTVPSIPAAVTNMQGCFARCTKLTSVTLKCNYNPAQLQGNPAFGNAFVDCTELKAGSIKVPSNQVDAYKAGADDMGTEQDRFVAAP